METVGIEVAECTNTAQEERSLAIDNAVWPWDSVTMDEVESFVNLAGDEVVGYAKFSLTAARPNVALRDITGVKRAWRGRGIAGALKRAQIAWAKRAGYERLQTQNELRNEPFRRLNEALGCRPAPCRVVMRRPLADERSHA